MYFFNVFNIDTYSYSSLNDTRKILSDLGLQMVPVLDENYPLENDVENLVAKSKMKSTLLADTLAEGIVIRPVEENTDTLVLQGRVSFKVINPDFLITYDE